jgi:eukaryotic-like serine/threonine-protein kinase
LVVNHWKEANMTPERWRRIEDLYRAAMGRVSEERAMFLEDACGEDEGLRRSVESLLEHNEKSGPTLNEPTDQLAAEALDTRVGAHVPGSMVGRYRILGRLGAGGMGEVYRARDTRLHRDVALKFLAPDQLADAEYRRRFLKEARAASALNHPNIVTFYDLLFEDGQDVLVLEYVAGRSLNRMISAKSLDFREAIEIAIAIADALAAAHQAGIVHRDVKPANVIVTLNKSVKLLDFGLAKVTARVDAEGTRTASLHTREGKVIGTAAYMSPEQAEGRNLDQRSDIFSFGVLLYEMLTGRTPFLRDTVTATLAAVLRDEPEAPESVPASIADIISRCMRKDPARRAQSMADIKVALEEARSDRSPSSATSQAIRAGRPFRRRWLAVAMAALTFTLALWLALEWRKPTGEVRAARLRVNPPPGKEFTLGGTGGGAISPDGRMVAFVAGPVQSRTLWIRPLDAVSAREVPESTGALFPFWGPNGKSVAFFTADGEMKRADVSGGRSVLICDKLGGGRGGTWNAAGNIVFGSVFNGPLQRVAASGGAPQPLTTLDPAREELLHAWPQFLPDGRRFLFFVNSFKPEFRGIYIGSLDRPQEKTLVMPSPWNALYARPNGNRPASLLWVRGGNLVAQPFDLREARLTGDAVPVAEAIATAPDLNMAYFSVADEGTVIYQAENTSRRFQLQWFSRDGKELSAVGEPDLYRGIRISPDGARAAYIRDDGSGHSDIWLIEFARGVRTRLTFNGAGHFVWSPDGRWMVYGARPRVPGAFQASFFLISLTGAAREELLLHSPESAFATDWSPDGTSILYTQKIDTYDLFLLPLARDRKLVPFLQTSFREYQGQFSPDGKWVAYTSDESGRNEIYVRSFPDGGGKLQISATGGSYPRWARTGAELFFIAADKKLMTVPIRHVANAIETGSPTALFRVVEPLRFALYSYDIAPDGRRVLALGSTPDSEAASMTVVLNWQAGLK